MHGGAAAAAEVGGLSKEFKGLAASQEEAGAAGATAGGKMGRLGSVGALAGKGLLALGAAAVGVGFEAVKMSNTFNTEMLKIRTEGGATGKEFNHMKSAVLDMASSGASMGQGPTSLAMGLYHVESMGMRGRKALLALKLAAQETAISGADLEQTTTSLGGALFIAAKGTGTLQQTMGTLNAIAGAGNMRFQQLNEALGAGLLTSAKVAGVSLQEAGAALAVLTDAGTPASSAAAQLATALHFLYAPTTKAQTALKGIHLTGDTLAADLHKPQGLLAALKDLRTHMEGMSKIQQAKVLNSILPGGRGRVLLSLYQMQGRLGPKYGQIMGTGGSFNAHVMEQQRNQATRLAEAHARLQAGMVRLGNVLTKYLTPALIWLEHAGANVLGWVVKASPVIMKFASFVVKDWAWWFHAVGDAMNWVVNAGAKVELWVQGAGKSISNFVSGGMKMFAEGWNQILGILNSVGNALTSISNFTMPQLPSLPGGAPHVTGHGTAGQRQALTKAAKSVGITVPPISGHVRTSASGTGIVPHAVYNGPDLNIHIGGHHFAKITKREIQKAMMAGA